MEKRLPTQFLVMRVTLCSCLVVVTEGLHPAAMDKPGTLHSHRSSGFASRQPTTAKLELQAEKLVLPPNFSMLVVLECIYGAGVSDLATLI